MSLSRQIPESVDFNEDFPLLTAIRTGDQHPESVVNTSAVLKVVSANNEVGAEVSGSLPEDDSMPEEDLIEPTLDHIYSFLHTQAIHIQQYDGPESVLIDLNCFAGKLKAIEGLKFWSDIRSKDIRKFGESNIPDFCIEKSLDAIILNPEWKNDFPRMQSGYYGLAEAM